MRLLWPHYVHICYARSAIRLARPERREPIDPDRWPQFTRAIMTDLPVFSPQHSLPREKQTCQCLKPKVCKWRSAKQSACELLTDFVEKRGTGPK